MKDNLRHHLSAFVRPHAGIACRNLRAAAYLGLAMAACSSVVAETGTDEIRIENAQGIVKVMPAGATEWVVTQAGQVLHPQWRLRTEANSRVVLRWSDQSVVSYGALSEVEILPPEDPQGLSGLTLAKGIMYF